MKWFIFVAIVVMAVVGAVALNPSIEAEIYGKASASKPAAPVGGSVF